MKDVIDKPLECIFNMGPYGPNAVAFCGEGLGACEMEIVNGQFGGSGGGGGGGGGGGRERFVQGSRILNSIAISGLRSDVGVSQLGACEVEILNF